MPTPATPSPRPASGGEVVVVFGGRSEFGLAVAHRLAPGRTVVLASRPGGDVSALEAPLVEAGASLLEMTLLGVRDAHQRAAAAHLKWKARAEQAEQLIPAYAMLDIWMALGRDSIHFDDWYDKHGYADAWAELTSAVREARTAPAVTCAHRNAVADHLWNAMVGSAKSVVRDVVAQAFAAAGIEVAVEAEAAVDPVEPEGDVIVRDASGHMWWVTDDGWTNGSSRLDHDWSDVPKPIRSVYRVEQEESSDE